MLERISSHISLWSIKSHFIHPVAYCVKYCFLLPPIFVFVLFHQLIGLCSQIVHKNKNIIFPQLQPLYVVPHQFPGLPYVSHLLFHKWGSFLCVSNHLIFFCLVRSWIRVAGQTVDRAGCSLQGNHLFQEQVSRHRTLMNLFDEDPVVDKDVFVAPGASVIGDVQVGRGSSIWYGCVLRGDVNSISVGSGTNIQDNALVHVANSNISGNILPTTIGNNVTVGHGAVLHGCTVEDEPLVSMGATLFDGAHVEKNAVVANGALVRQNTRIPFGEVWRGNPAKFTRKLTEEEIGK